MNKLKTINIGSFNLIKGFAMTIVVIGHMLFNYNFTGAVNFFPLNILSGILKSGILPLFFLVSGYGFKEKPIQTILKKTFSEFISAYIKVMVLVTVLFPVCHYITYRWWPGAVRETVRYLLAFLLGIPKYGKELFGLTLYWNTPAWFFLGLFVAINLLNILLKIKNQHVRHIVLLAIVGVGFLLLEYDFNYYCIAQGFLATGFCYIGYLIKKYKFFTAADNKLMWCVIAVGAVWQCIYSEFNLADGYFQHGVFSYLGTMCLCIVLLYAGLYFSDIDNPVLDAFRTIGVYTYWIMSVHSIESTCIPWYLLQGLSLPPLVIFAIEITLKIIIILSCCFVIKKVTMLKFKRRLASNAEK